MSRKNKIIERLEVEVTRLRGELKNVTRQAKEADKAARKRFRRAERDIATLRDDVLAALNLGGGSSAPIASVTPLVAEPTAAYAPKPDESESVTDAPPVPAAARPVPAGPPEADPVAAPPAPADKATPVKNAAPAKKARAEKASSLEEIPAAN